METSCIANITNSFVMKWKDLYAAKFAFNIPFQIALDNEEWLYAEEVVRLIPKRRMVVFGKWRGKTVVAKLFFDAQYSRHHREKDLAGIRLLQKYHIPTPNVLYEGSSEDRRIYIIICEKISPAQNLEQIWEEKKKY